MPKWESTSAVEHAIVYCLTGGVISVPFGLAVVVSSGRLSIVFGVLWTFALLALLFDQINELVTIQLDQHGETELPSDTD